TSFGMTSFEDVTNDLTSRCVRFERIPPSPELLHPRIHIVPEPLYELIDKFSRIQLVVLDQRSEFDSEVHQLGRVDSVALKVSGIRAAASRGSQIVAFTAGDL